MRPEAAAAPAVMEGDSASASLVVCRTHVAPLDRCMKSPRGLGTRSMMERPPEVPARADSPATLRLAHDVRGDVSDVLVRNAPLERRHRVLAIGDLILDLLYIVHAELLEGFLFQRLLGLHQVEASGMASLAGAHEDVLAVGQIAVGRKRCRRGDEGDRETQRSAGGQGIPERLGWASTLWPPGRPRALRHAAHLRVRRPRQVGRRGESGVPARKERRRDKQSSCHRSMERRHRRAARW
mmetsp:Transcript_32592/g.96805  ORF Transcript_32592/g.96805 Transcript_32592/m.96805 type:complete len:239 (+) Transcript_32592:28-744(+)